MHQQTTRLVWVMVRLLCLRTGAALQARTSAATILKLPRAGVVRELSATTEDSESKQYRVVFCLGGPGAGKGTQCELLEREFGLVHLSAGELLRRERSSGSADGDLIESYLSEGKIVPVALSLGLLRREMDAHEGPFVVDGFPRNQDNLDGWNELMPDATVEAVLFIDVPVDVMVQRMLSRGETSGRSDDNETAARKRIDTFRQSTLPILDHFEKQGSLVRVPGEGTVDEVWALTKAALQPILGDPSSD